MLRLESTTQWDERTQIQRGLAQPVAPLFVPAPPIDVSHDPSSLLDQCLSFIAHNVQDLVSLEGIPWHLRFRLLRYSNRLHTLTPAALEVIIGNGLQSDDAVSRLDFSQMDYLPPLLLDTICSTQRPTVTMLNLSGCDRLSDVLGWKLVNAFPKLTSLVLSECRGVGDQTLEAITNCPNLEVLDLSGIELASTDVLWRLLASAALPKLRVLSLSFCRSVNPPLAAAILATHAARLRHVCLGGCPMTPRLLDALASAPGIVFLDVSYSGMCLPDLLLLLRACPNLISLNVSGCDALFDSWVEQGYQLPHIEELSASDLTDLALDNIAALFPNLRRLTASECAVSQPATLLMFERCLRLHSVSMLPSVIEFVRADRHARHLQAMEH